MKYGGKRCDISEISLIARSERKSIAGNSVSDAAGFINELRIYRWGLDTCLSSPITQENR
ncbi:hypothetical protein Hanom_Chr14g01305631 [Helianthus anomalus]